MLPDAGIVNRDTVPAIGTNRGAIGSETDRVAIHPVAVAVGVADHDAVLAVGTDDVVADDVVVGVFG